jgi:arsenate reductase (thioredoxin)
MLPALPPHKKSQLARRDFIGSVCILAAGLNMAPNILSAKTMQPRKILFVCQYGTAKSVIAREFFRKRAKHRGIDVQAISRGLTIEDHITAKLRKNLAADHIDPNIEPIRSMAQEDWQSADIVIAFNPLPTSVTHGDVRDWTDLPSVNDKYKKARSIMKRRIDRLLDEISVQ